MSSLLNSTRNTRPLNNGSLKYIRSDAVCELSDEEIAWLIENNVMTIVDLRSAEEAGKEPCCLRDRVEFKYINIPVSGGNTVPESADAVSISYLNMVDDMMWEIISVIENAETNVLYFCHAGKDRTGVVSALLLLKQNVSHEEIIDDYMRSSDNLEALLDEYCRNNPKLNKDILMPKSTYIEQFLHDV